MVKAMFEAGTTGFVNLLAEVPVVPGAVVSKALVNTDGCKVIVFAMDQGQSIREHHAPYVATVQVLAGRLDFHLLGNQHELVANDWLLMPFDSRHDLTALEPTRFLLTLLR